MRIIKRYPNRKLYDTETKQYVTLDELAEMIRADDELRVYDNASGEDLTALTMTQVLFEQVKKQAGFLPRTVLAGLIQAGGSRFSGLQRRLAGPLGFNHLVDEEIHRRIDLLVGQGKLSQEEAERISGQLISAEMRVEELKPEERAVEQVLEDRGVATHSQLKQLLDQIEALSERLDTLEPEDGKDSSAEEESQL